jgi:hypothetical protein
MCQPDPCTEEANDLGCTCTVPLAWSNAIDTPEPRIAKDCPLHGWAPDPDDARQAAIDDANE